MKTFAMAIAAFSLGIFLGGAAAIGLTEHKIELANGALDGKPEKVGDACITLPPGSHDVTIKGLKGVTCSETFLIKLGGRS